MRDEVAIALRDKEIVTAFDAECDALNCGGIDDTETAVERTMQKVGCDRARFNQAVKRSLAGIIVDVPVH